MELNKTNFGKYLDLITQEDILSHAIEKSLQRL